MVVDQHFQKIYLPVHILRRDPSVIGLADSGERGQYPLVPRKHGGLVVGGGTGYARIKCQ